jgi:hypothetical protein
VGEQGTAGDFVQHFRPAGAHALALAGGKDDCEAAPVMMIGWFHGFDLSAGAVTPVGVFIKVCCIDDP